ncbi:bile acid:sodium symporter family protein [Aquibacillus sp. 3ASR75-11]|uniref:Bile acid:sodium symporter family protein n=1 Tax=Terrihalobacillus insolitus TaxID=2950438 RepID=A0A9X3WTQ9_9BACI|nr:bile acid:sodium symporter family protein [Terrihalobacillus insolitus]MDC3412138.1 bile acid:sodium symporter family protein [Terrihalobacillus insolitus]MDC3423169.1 bile acid:sodium symporter family protein [Terrihalobacillus insolitus]
MKTLEKISSFVGSTFAVWVLLFAILSFVIPTGFTWIAPYIVPLLGIIMFGMGLTLSANDFKEVFRRPKDVAIGVGAQFTIMPLLAFALATLLPVSPEVAVGVILVGSCPGGTSSNVMTYLSKGDTALSVSITAVSTLLAPILTPALILLFASRWLPVSAGDLFLSIVKIVLVPIILGLVVKYLFGRKIEAGVKALPLVSVVAIVAIVAAVVGVNQEKIAETGLIIFAIVVLHNCLGYLFGYLLGKAFGMSPTKKRAVSIEVGMQNSGLGASLAAIHFSPLAAVPSAIFSVWHNISGPIIATIFRKQQEKEIESDDDRKSA